jgi:hypothetical protein
VARELGYHEVAIADRRASGALITPS